MNTFNRALRLAIPIGQRYPLNERRGYRLTLLIYDYEEIQLPLAAAGKYRLSQAPTISPEPPSQR